MESMATVKMLIDIGFVMSVVFVCYRAAKNRNATTNGADSVDVSGIEKSVRGVINEAEEVSRELSRELGKRQRTLEQILFDLETIESKISRASSQADDRINELHGLLSSPSYIENNIGNPEVSPSPDSEKRVESLEIDQPLVSPDKIVNAKQENLRREDSRREVLISLTDSIEVVRHEATNTDQDDSKYNIFGEPVATAAEQTLTTISSRIEIERDTEFTQKPKPVTDRQINDGRDKVQQIYNKAKSLLTAGENVAKVAAATRLPMSTIEKIRSTISIEPEVVPNMPPSRDLRLGVLSGMRRSIETI